MPALADSTNNPGLLLGAVVGAAAKGGRNKLVLTGVGSALPGFGDWAEQLVAESTGKAAPGFCRSCSRVPPGRASGPAP
jgi:glucose-6-phosphate isomerase